jgi:hypothetical protein
MLIRLGDGAQASGSRGGTTYSRNRSGAYTRARSVPVNPNSPAQNAVRINFREAAFAWSAILSQGQRDQWDVYADVVPWKNRLGDTIKLSGFNWYLASSTARASAGLAPVLAGPAILELAAPPTDTISTPDVSAQTISTAFDNTNQWATEVGGALIISQGLPGNEGVKFFGGPFRIQNFVLGAVIAPTSPAVAAAAFALGIGQTVPMTYRVVLADGRFSTPVQFTFPAVP